jgi:hypothetical protein
MPFHNEHQPQTAHLRSSCQLRLAADEVITEAPLTYGLHSNQRHTQTIVGRGLERAHLSYPLLVVAYQNCGVAARTRESCHPIVVARYYTSAGEQRTLLGDHTVLEALRKVDQAAWVRD